MRAYGARSAVRLCVCLSVCLSLVHTSECRNGRTDLGSVWWVTLLWAQLRNHVLG